MPVRLTALCGAAGLATGCGAGVSLDDPTPDSSPIGTDSSPSITSTGPGQGDGDTEGAARLDLGAASDLGVGPLPPGLCPPDCQFELSLQWAYDGPPAALPMPEDRVGMIVIDDLGFVVAEQRQGAVTLAWLDPSGLEQWTLPVPLPCDPCRRVELTRHPTGDLLLSGDGQGPTGSPIAYVARVELGTQAVRWTNTVQLATGDGVVPRTGPLIVLDDERMAIPAVQGSAFAGQERLDLLIHRTTDGTLAYIETIAQGPATGDAPVPQASLETPDVVALGRPI
ncbi:MAG: hypothetical protein KDK70_04200, partial [Myxococcales bacterium]|nr:hypothetical protein [Myxococcales bacterium]